MTDILKTSQQQLCYCSHLKANFGCAKQPNYISSEEETCFCRGRRAEVTTRADTLCWGNKKFGLPKPSRPSREGWQGHQAGNGNETSRVFVFTVWPFSPACQLHVKRKKWITWHNSALAAARPAAGPGKSKWQQERSAGHMSAQLCVSIIAFIHVLGSKCFYHPYEVRSGQILTFHRQKRSFPTPVLSMFH